MLSLRQLLAQQSQTPVKEEQDEVESNQASRNDKTSKKRRRDEQKKKDDDSSSSEEEWFGDGRDLVGSQARYQNDDENDLNEFSEKYATALGAIYSTEQSASSINVDLVNEALHPEHSRGMKYTSRLERLEPKTKRVKRNGEVLFITENKEEIAERVKKVDRQNERSRIRKRWKARAINFTQEEDVGNAFELRAKRLLEDDIRKEEQERQNLDQGKEEEKKRDADDIESVDEQNVLLERLTQSQSMLDDDEQKNDQDETQNRNDIPYKERMDYWEYGKAIPNHEDLQKYSYKDHANFRSELTLPVETNDKGTKKELSLAFNTFMRGRKRHRQEPYHNQFILPSNEGDIDSLDRHSHVRFFRVIAARYLCGNVGDTKLEDRMLRILLSRTRNGLDKGPVSDFDGSQTLLALGHQLGANMIYYSENKWRDPVMATKYLGLEYDLGGCTLKPLRLRKFFESLRCIVGKRYKSGNSLSLQGQSADDSVIPTSVFAHLPGTKAPVPTRPLEPPGIVFGPIDRHAKFFDKAKLDDVTFRLAVSKYLSSLAKENTRIGDDGLGVQEICNRLKLFVEEYVKMHDSKICEFYAVCENELDTPCSQFYRAMMAYVSLVSTGSISGIDSESGDADESCTDDIQMHQVADVLYSFLDSRVDHIGLLRFPRVHLVHALIKVCRSLPKSAADILSMATGFEDYQTPLEIVRKTLEHMEERSFIVAEKEDEDESVDHASLEYLMHDASSSLQHCVKIDPLNVEYHLWHIAFLAACLLLCSGNKIGSGAHLYPSEREEQQIRRKKSPKHEIRPKLPKFDEMRILLSTAAKLLLELAKYQDGPRIHQGVSSFLEWNEVIALLVGDSNTEHFTSINQIHKFHLVKWTLRERPKMALSHPEVSRDLSYLALELENKPGKIENWREFIKKVGPLKYKESRHDADVVHKAACPNCRYLRESTIFDHEELLLMRSDTLWWGKHRSWWIDGLLGVDSLIVTRYAPATKSVVQKLETCMPEVVPCPQYHENNAEDAKDIEWLENVGENLTNSREKTAKERSFTYDSQLPKRFLYVCRTANSDRIDDNDLKLPEFRGPTAQRMELACYKILIFCHLKDNSISEVESYIHGMIKASWDKEKKEVNENSDEFVALQWLCYVGIDVPKLARESLSRRGKSQDGMKRTIN